MNFVREGAIVAKDTVLDVSPGESLALQARGYVAPVNPITPLQPEWLDRIVSVDVRSWDFLAEPTYRRTDAGYTVLLSSPMMRVTTATGVNKGVEYYEYCHQNPYGSIGGGSDWLDLRQIVKCWISNVAATNPAGDCLVGIELGSMKAAPPWATNYAVNTLSAIQLRYNAARSKWEFLIYDCDEVAPTVEDCTVQPPTIATNNCFELMLDYQPGDRIDCYVTGQLVHTYRDSRLLSFQVNPSGADAGGGIFVTSGSNAAGRMQAEFFSFKAITVGRKPRV